MKKTIQLETVEVLTALGFKHSFIRAKVKESPYIDLEPCTTPDDFTEFVNSSPNNTYFYDPNENQYYYKIGEADRLYKGAILVFDKFGLSLYHFGRAMSQLAADKQDAIAEACKFLESEGFTVNPA